MFGRVGGGNNQGRAASVNLLGGRLQKHSNSAAVQVGLRQSVLSDIDSCTAIVPSLVGEWGCAV